MLVSRRRLVGALVTLSLAGVAYVGWPRTAPSQRELVLRTVVQMAHAADERDVPGVMEHVSERFRSAEGWDQRELKAVVAHQLLSGQWVRVFTSEVEVTVTSPTQVELTGKFVFGRSAAKRLEDLARDSVLAAYAVEGRLEKESDGEWRFVWASHRPLKAGGLYQGSY
jgi:hypothetical protein